MAEDTQLTPEPTKSAADSRPKPVLRRPGWLRLSHEHTAFSAMLLLMVSVLLSRVIGLVRIKVIAFLFGAGSLTDAYTAAFQLPDMLTYLLAGGTASITFITILSRYREQGREHEGEQTISVILSSMLLVLGTAILLGEIFAPLYVSIFLSKFDPATAALCVHMTRIVLPGQLCFFAGGVLSAVLLVRKQFAWQAVTPLIYSLGIILGGILLHRALGVSSLAVGALVGAICGPLLLNYYAAHRIGLRLRFSLDWSHPGLRDWVRMSIPLMIGVSLVSADTWILNYFASGGHGDIAKLNYAKTLFQTPMAILGQAAGAASMPFFAALIGQGRHREFANSVNRIVTRIYAFAFLLSGWMIGMAYPAVDLVLRGGSLHHRDVGSIALYFTLFAGSLCFWSAQAIYARAFYAAGDTFTPMAASTVITAASIPIYWFLFHHLGVRGPGHRVRLRHPCANPGPGLPVAPQGPRPIRWVGVRGDGQIPCGGHRLLRSFVCRGAPVAAIGLLSPRSAATRLRHHRLAALRLGRPALVPLQPAQSVDQPLSQSPRHHQPYPARSRNATHRKNLGRVFKCQS